MEFSLLKSDNTSFIIIKPGNFLEETISKKENSLNETHSNIQICDSVDKISNEQQTTFRLADNFQNYFRLEDNFHLMKCLR